MWLVVNALGMEAATSSESSARRGRLARLVWKPAVVVLVVAPWFGEVLSGSSSPIGLLVPWNLAFFAALYGTGALICREIARRRGLGLPGLILLGAAYGVYEEGLVDRYWFYPKFWHDSGVDHYSVVFDTNTLLAVHLTIFHAAISITAAVLIVERLFPTHRESAWAGLRGLVFAGFALALIPFIYGEFQRGPGAPQLIAAAVICAGLVAAALAVPWFRWRTASRSIKPSKPPRPRPSRPRLGLIAFSAFLVHWIIVYSLASTGIPWPVGIALAVLPVAGGAFLIARRAVGDEYGPDALRVISGLVAFFIALDLFLGVLGRFDLALGGLATWYVLRRLRRRDIPNVQPA